MKCISQRGLIRLVEHSLAPGQALRFESHQEYHLGGDLVPFSPDPGLDNIF